jgi:hypothetical protein
MGGGEDGQDNAHGSISSSSSAPSTIAPVKVEKRDQSSADGRPTHALMTKEERVVGVIQQSVLWAFVNASGGWLVVLLLAVLVVPWQCTRIAADL